jgi:hypothetical protein
VRKQVLGSIVGAAVIGALIWTGCGGGGEDSLTKAEFTRKANTVCSKWQQARDQRYPAASSKFAPLTSTTNKEKAILYIMSPYEATIEDLGELPPPAGEEKKVETLVKAMEEAMARTRREPLMTSKKAFFKKSNELVDSYGLEECKV